MSSFSADTVRVNLGDKSYEILVGAGLLSSASAAEKLSAFVKDKDVLVVGDSTTSKLFSSRVLALLNEAGAKTCTETNFPAGEGSKNFLTVENVCRRAVEAGLDRHGVFVALGGGVTGDLTGFAASIYMRGVKFIQIPTTLLAVTDSSIGGKTGADLPEGKNLIGTFHQPSLVLADTDTLVSLPEKELCSGFAEVIKHAILFDGGLFDTLSSERQSLLVRRDVGLLAKILAVSCRMKAKIVEADEKETSFDGGRVLLNLGHTFAHAMEKSLDFKGLSHGEAVAVGLAASALLSEKLSLAENGLYEKVSSIVKLYNLPLAAAGCSVDKVFDAMRSDKKNKNGKIRFVLPVSIGRAVVKDDVPDALVKSVLEAVCD